ncbi:MAG: aspartate--tRNA ligase [Spirochaetia bacterium]|nr:aspartate--tRNA ligase [Spirochaetia bacterium]
MKRTATCGELTKKDAGRMVTLNGWVHRNRNHGEIQFINLRDTYGITQVFIGDDADKELKKVSAELRFEYCVAISGVVKERPETMINPDMTTGEIEIEAKNIEILSRCEVLPFMIDEESDAKEDLRLTYRYLDLRSGGMQKRIKLRTAFTFAVREYLTKQGFMEIETPTLIKSTPEGARDFLVPSRVQAGKFYALPQSPQLFKQILMVSGFDRYFQIARCYRDEDARGDRQLEFTQVDLEMSFVSRDDVLKVTEGMFQYVFEKTMQYKLPETFTRLTYEEAMNTYGSDKPDLRFELPIKSFDTLAADTTFNAFTSVLEAGGSIKALNAKGCATYSRKMISELEQAAKIYGAKGLAWAKVTEAGLEGGITKFISEQADEIISSMEAEPGDLLLMIADKWSVCCNSLGAVRSKLGKDLGLIDPAKFVFCWIIDFPLFEYNENENRWEAAHHMFSMPQAQYLDTMEQDPGAVKGDLYDLVLNGYEVASGSIRIHDPEIQKRIFSIVGFSEEVAEERFGFLLKAFRYGPPPHGGIAPGLDRMVMIMAGQTSIKEVIPFPKNTVGISPMENSPSIVDEQQLKDLHLKLDFSEDN